MKNFYLLFVLLCMGTGLSARAYTNGYTAGTLQSSNRTPDVHFVESFICDSGTMVVKVAGTFASNDSIVQYSWSYGIQGGITYYSTEKSINFTMTDWIGSVSLYFVTASGQSGYISKTYYHGWWNLSIGITKVYGCADSALISVTDIKPGKHPFFKWSNGVTGVEQIVVKESGLYGLGIYDSCGNLRAGDTIFVELAKEPVIVQEGMQLKVSNFQEYYTYTWYKDNVVIGAGNSVAIQGEGVYIVEQVGETCKKASKPYAFNATSMYVALNASVSFCDSTQWYFNGRVTYIPVGDEVLTYMYDYGDGTTGTANNHQYGKAGEYQVTYKVNSKQGKQASDTQVIYAKLRHEVRVEIHRGVQDTIVGFPVNYDKENYTSVKWSNYNDITEYGSWYIIPRTDDYYYIFLEPEGCYTSAGIFYEAGSYKTVLTPPAAHADKLDVGANFKNTIFDPSNIFTIQLMSEKDGSIKELGSIQGTNPTSLPVDIPIAIKDGNYKVRVASSAPAYTADWSIVFPVVNELTVIPVVTPPVANAKQLDVSADFQHLTFQPENTFTIQLSTHNPGARAIEAGTIMNLGTVNGTDASKLTVNLPDSLSCATNYRVRIVSSAPVDTSSWSADFTIINQPSPPLITQVGDSLFTNSSYDLQWYKDDVAIAGTTAAAIRAKANGVYKVAALNGTCSTLSEARSVVVTAVADVTLGGNKVTAFPNPSEGKVYLKFATPPTEKVLVKVLNVSGTSVYTTTTMQQQTLLELSTLPKGLYLVEVSTKKGHKVLTIILQ